MNRLVEMYRSLPNAARWGVWAGAAFLVYFLIVEPAVDESVALRARADERARALSAMSRADGSGPGAVELGRRRFGDVELPGEAETRSVVFNRKVSEILQRHNIRDLTSTTRTVPMNQGPLPSVMPADERVDRLVRDIQFEATPETVAGVIADLERAPEVARVARVQLRTASSAAQGTRLVRAVVSAEAWVINRKARGR